MGHFGHSNPEHFGHFGHFGASSGSVFNPDKMDILIQSVLLFFGHFRKNPKIAGRYDLLLVFGPPTENI